MQAYLDNSATTSQYEEVTKKMLQCMQDNFGNPSSLHDLGFAAEKAVKEARQSLAVALEAKNEEIYFTSGGTESNNMALFGAAETKKRQGNRVLISSMEHPAVLESARRLSAMGFDVKTIGVDEKGRLNEEELFHYLDEKTILISIMQVNNETGIILPVSEIYSRIRAKMGNRVALHTDGVQAFGKIPVRVQGTHMISVSAHKIHGPKGCGALFLQKEMHIEPLLRGGGQERNLRSGTENVPAIAGFGIATKMAYGQMKKRAGIMSAARRYLLEGIKAEIDDIQINSIEEDSIDGKSGFCCPSLLNISFLGTKGEVLLHSLERWGIYVSTGAACSSNKKGRSHVLSAMGLTEKEIEGALRFSFSEFNTMEQMDFVLCKIKDEVAQFRKVRRFK